MGLQLGFLMVVLHVEPAMTKQQAEMYDADD